MTFIPQVDLGESFGPFRAFQQNFGFLPNLFPAQSLLPRAIEAEAAMAGAVLLAPGALSQIQKESILFTLAARSRNTYCTTAHAYRLRSLGLPEPQIGWLARDHRSAGLSATDTALLDFSLKLGLRPASFGSDDIEALRGHAFTDTQILEAILTTSLTAFLCALSIGLDATPDFEPRVPAPDPAWAENGAQLPRAGRPGPYLEAVQLPADAFPPFVFFRESFGFVPNIFRAQTLRPDVLEAEAQVIRDVLLPNDVLKRVQKEYILLVISAANWNTYCVAVHCEMLRGLGIPEDESDQIALDHRQARLSAADKALLDCALKLAMRPDGFGRSDIDLLRGHGFSEAQILEAVVMTSLTRFLNTLQTGLGTVSDFPPRRVFSPPAGADVNLSPAPARLIIETGRRLPAERPAEDPDASLVALVKNGEVDAFEELVKRHERRVYRTLIGVLGNAEDAEDGAQHVFLKAFARLGTFEGSSKFSTWLIRIAMNEGIERLRRRKDEESLEGLEEAALGDTEPFRPRLVQAWEDPEALYARTELRELLERELLKLPPPYRMAVILRDIEQFSTAEAAEAMSLPIPTLKTRLARGRLMLRESLANRFQRSPQGTSNV
jgi:RNA polymerase sigma-70 factor, ECF subfamily